MQLLSLDAGRGTWEARSGDAWCNYCHDDKDHHHCATITPQPSLAPYRSLISWQHQRDYCDYRGGHGGDLKGSSEKTTSSLLLAVTQATIVDDSKLTFARTPLAGFRVTCLRLPNDRGFQKTSGAVTALHTRLVAGRSASLAHNRLPTLTIAIGGRWKDEEAQAHEAMSAMSLASPPSSDPTCKKYPRSCGGVGAQVP